MIFQLDQAIANGRSGYLIRIQHLSVDKYTSFKYVLSRFKLLWYFVNNNHSKQILIIIISKGLIDDEIPYRTKGQRSLITGLQLSRANQK